MAQGFKADAVVYLLFECGVGGLYPPFAQDLISVCDQEQLDGFLSHFCLMNASASYRLAKYAQ